MPRHSAEEQGVRSVQARWQVDDNGTEVADHAGRIAALDRRGGDLEEVDLVVQARLHPAALVFSDGVEGGLGGGRGGVEDPAGVGAEIAAAAQLQGQRGDEIDQAGLVGAPREHLPGGAQGAADQGGAGDRRERRAPSAASRAAPRASASCARTEKRTPAYPSPASRRRRWSPRWWLGRITVTGRSGSPSWRSRIPRPSHAVEVEPGRTWTTPSDGGEVTSADLADHGANSTAQPPSVPWRRLGRSSSAPSVAAGRPMGNGSKETTSRVKWSPDGSDGTWQCYLPRDQIRRARTTGASPDGGTTKKPYPEWMYYPSRVRPPAWVDDIVQAVAACRVSIDTSAVRGLRSNVVLKHLAPRLRISWVLSRNR